jgi:LmbE family N-acetylglucosaminyl deacetylase
MTGAEEQMVRNSALIVAHPDDEMLWFSSVMNRVDKIIVCWQDFAKMPELGPARQASLRRHPLPIVSLGIEQSDAFKGADWQNPVLTGYGIAIPRRPAAEERYRSNYQVLRQHLRRELAGYTQVFTHSPWGEYGHEEHIQVYRVVKELQQKQHFRLWYPNYCSDKSLPLMLQHSAVWSAERMTLSTDRELAVKIMQIYQECDCWTWFPDWLGADEETFMGEDADPAEGEPGVGVFPLNFMRLGRPVEKRSFLKKIFG